MWRLWNKLFGWHYVRIDNVGITRLYRFGFDWFTKIYKARYRLGSDNKLWREYHSVDYIPLTFKPEELIK